MIAAGSPSPRGDRPRHPAENGASVRDNVMTVLTQALGLMLGERCTGAGRGADGNIRSAVIRSMSGLSSTVMTPGALLREARTPSGLSQADLAARAGVAQSVISIYESGCRHRVEVLRLIEMVGGSLTTLPHRLWKVC
jgi:hypothetical protein